MVDLGEVRIRLDQMTERLLSRLKDRSRFPRNPAVYQPDGVPIDGREGISFLEFAIEGLERYHASLGRYDFPDQFPLLTSNTSPAPVHRQVSQAQADRLAIPIKDRMLEFYMSVLDRLCAPGDDPATFGETVYTDADLLQLLHERVNIGRLVAEAKVAADPGLWETTEPQDLRAALQDRAREEKLLQSVEATASRYDLDEGVARSVFEWVIETTLGLEVSYIRELTLRRSGEQQAAGAQV